jgi:hypothetical protein
VRENEVPADRGAKDLDMFRNPMSHELKADFLGHQIAVHFSANFLAKISAESKLYIDGKVEDTSKDIVAFANAALLRGSITENGKVHVVEIYARSGLFTTKWKIVVDGQWLAGDRF